MPSVQELSKILDELYTVPVIRDYIGDATRVKIDYGTVISVNNSAHAAMVQFVDGYTMRMETGAIEVLVGEVWRCRRRFGSWSTDDMKR